MERTILHDAESLRKRITDTECFSDGALALLLEVIKSGFISRLENPEFKSEHGISDKYLCGETFKGASYVVDVEGSQVFINLQACDMDIRGYNGSWHVTSCIGFKGSEAAVLRLNRLFLDYLARAELNGLKEQVREMLAANSHHFVLIDHRRPFYDAAK
ncbi:hypothetical protein HGA34_05050 [Candidatus Falkowbacteria bacterium]|nr:hypothetical protein [Candidatus Falkowbacteria bacterium]